MVAFAVNMVHEAGASLLGSCLLSYLRCKTFKLSNSCIPLHFLLSDQISVGTFIPPKLCEMLAPGMLYTSQICFLKFYFSS